MSIKNVLAGKSIPDDFNALIEITADGNPVKYEVDKDTGLLVVDRFMPTAMRYPCNYGFVPSTLADDGDPVDVLVLTPIPIQPGALIRVRALGVLQMTDESGEDAKILAVPIKKVCAEFSHIESLQNLSPSTLSRISHFFEQYKALEPNKWVKIKGWEGVEAAAKEINDSIARFEQQSSGVVA